MANFTPWCIITFLLYTSHNISSDDVVTTVDSNYVNKRGHPPSRCKPLHYLYTKYAILSLVRL